MATFCCAGCAVELKHQEGIHEFLFHSVTMRAFQSLIPFLPLAKVFPGTPEILLKSSRTCLSGLETGSHAQNRTALARSLETGTLGSARTHCCVRFSLNADPNHWQHLPEPRAAIVFGCGVFPQQWEFQNTWIVHVCDCRAVGRKETGKKEC